MNRVRHTLFLVLGWLFLSPGIVFGANLVTNGSFEVGSWGWNRWQDAPRPSEYIAAPEGMVDAYLSPDRPALGGVCLKIPSRKGFLLESDFIRVEPFAEYTLSFYARTDSTDSMPLRLLVLSGYANKQSSRRVAEIKKLFDLKDQWERYTIKGPLGVEGSEKHGFSIRFEGVIPSGNVYIDAVQMEKGGLTDYAPRNPVEVSGCLLDWEKSTHLYFPGEEVPVEVRCWNGQKEKLELVLEVLDIFDRPVVTIREPADFSTGQNLTLPVNLVVNKTGIFRLLITAVAGKRAVSNVGEVIFGVVPRPNDYGQPDEDSFVGFQGIERGEFKLNQIRKAGVKWCRLWGFGYGPGNYFGWNNTEPEKGKFVWYEKEADSLFNAGISILSTQANQPKWASSAPENISAGIYFPSPPRDYAEFTDFIRTTVSHYQGRVKYWEIGNEPYTEIFWRASPEEYSRYVKTASLAAKSVYPDCKIVAGVCSFSTLPFLERAFRAGLLDYIDILSFHDYGIRSNNDPDVGYRINKMRELMNKYGKNLPMWNTESGLFSRGFFRQIYYGEELKKAFYAPEKIPSAVSAAANLVKTLAESMANGVEKHFWFLVYSWGDLGGEYPNRIVRSDEYQQLMVERNGIPAPKLVSQSIYIHLLDKAKPVASFNRDLGDNRRINIYLFEKEKIPVAVIWGDNVLSGRYRFSLPLKPGQVQLLDLMGNEITGDDITFDRNEGSLAVSEMPVYLSGKGLSVGEMNAALSNGKLTGILSLEELQTIKKMQSFGIEREINSLDFDEWKYVKRIAVPDFIQAHLYQHRYTEEPMVFFWVDSQSASVSLPVKAKKAVKPSGLAVPLEYDGKTTSFRTDEVPLFLYGDNLSSSALADGFQSLTVSGIKPFVIAETKFTSEGYTLFFKSLVNCELTLDVAIIDEPPGLSFAGNKTGLKLAPYEGKRLVLPFAGSLNEITTSGQGNVRVRVTEKRFGDFEEEARIKILKAVPAAGAVKIDGDIHPPEWNGCEPIFLDKKGRLYAVAEEWQDSADCSGRVMAKWDKENLYLAFEITDDKLWQVQRGGDIYNGDCTEIFLSKSLTRHLGEKNVTADDFQLLFAPIPEKEGVCSVCASGPVKSAWQKTGSGYNIEVAVPWLCFGGLNPEKEPVVAFDAAIDDSDGGNRKYQMVWAGDGDNYRDRLRRGTLIFIK